MMNQTLTRWHRTIQFQVRSNLKPGGGYVLGGHEIGHLISESLRISRQALLKHVLGVVLDILCDKCCM
jgi:hypothetical protein